MLLYLATVAGAALLVNVLLGFLYGRLDGYIHKWWGGLIWVGIAIISILGGFSLATAFALEWPTQPGLVIASVAGAGYIIAVIYLASTTVEAGR